MVNTFGDYKHEQLQIIIGKMVDLKGILKRNSLYSYLFGKLK